MEHGGVNNTLCSPLLQIIRVMASATAGALLIRGLGAVHDFVPSRFFQPKASNLSGNDQENDYDSDISVEPDSGITFEANYLAIMTCEGTEARDIIEGLLSSRGEEGIRIPIPNHSRQVSHHRHFRRKWSWSSSFVWTWSTTADRRLWLPRRTNYRRNLEQARNKVDMGQFRLAPVH